MTPHNLEQHRIEVPSDALPKLVHGAGQDAGGGFFYIPDFISPDEEKYLLDKVSDQQISTTPGRPC